MKKKSNIIIYIFSKKNILPLLTLILYIVNGIVDFFTILLIYRILLFVLFLGFVILVYIYSLKTENEQKINSVIVKTLDNFLIILSYLTDIGKDAKLRVNIFMKNNTLDTHKIEMVYFSTNMENDCDLDIKLAKWQGCAGNAWGYEQLIVGSAKDISDKKSWSLTPDLEKLTEEVITILSIPIFNEKREEIIGILNFDANIDVKEKFLSKKITEYAISCSFILTNLLNNLDYIYPLSRE